MQHVPDEFSLTVISGELYGTGPLDEYAWLKIADQGQSEVGIGFHVVFLWILEIDCQADPVSKAMRNH